MKTKTKRGRTGKTKAKPARKPPPETALWVIGVSFLALISTAGAVTIFKPDQAQGVWFAVSPVLSSFATTFALTLKSALTH